jgi:hypothetical protein
LAAAEGTEPGEGEGLLGWWLIRFIMTIAPPPSVNVLEHDVLHYVESAPKKVEQDCFRWHVSQQLNHYLVCVHFFAFLSDVG